MFIGAYMAAMSAVMTVMTMMGMMPSLATTLATELVMHAARDVMLAVSAFVSFFEHIRIAEFVAISGATMSQLVLVVHLIVMLVMHCGFIMNLAAMLVVLAVMLLVFFVNFVTVMSHLVYSPIV